MSARRSRPSQQDLPVARGGRRAAGAVWRRLVLGLSCLGVAAALLSGGVAQARPFSCHIDSNKISPPTVREPDWVNRDAPTDYLAMVLSWSPEFCESKRNAGRATRKRFAHQCFSGNRFDWVAHGLWPQNANARSYRDHPRHCQRSEALPLKLIERHLCMMPSADLIQNEWQAHGTCGWPSPERYLEDTQNVYFFLPRPVLHEMLGTRPVPEPGRLTTLTAGEIKQAFIDLEPRLRPEHMRVVVGPGNRLKELWVCLDTDMTLRACPTGGTPDAQQIRVRSALR